MNLPNILTILRIVVIPIMVICFYLPYKWGPMLAAFIFFLACVTDWLDGYLARKLDQSTPLGQFLDPVADKLIVGVALVLATELYNDILMTIPAMIIIGREIVVSALREWMAELGKRASVAVSMVGKLKTLLQMICITGIIGWPIGDPTAILALILLWVTAGLTIWSMLIYLKAAWPSLKSVD